MDSLEHKYLIEEIDSLEDELTACEHDLDLLNKLNQRLEKINSELLDFINRISGEMLRNDFVLDEKWYEQSQQLIKSATQLNQI